MLLRQKWAWGIGYYTGREEYPKHRDCSSIPFAGAAVRHSGVVENKDLSSRVESEGQDL